MTARNKVGALWAGAGVTTRSEETQVAAGSLTGVLDCKHRKIALLKGAKAGKVSETRDKTSLRISTHWMFKNFN